MRGVIVDGYGKHAHAVRQSVTVNNTGINIAAEAGAPVKAVFEGEVSVVFFVPGMNNAVMIRHGDYVTVYANVEAVGVKTGDRVTLNRQAAGRRRLPAFRDMERPAESESGALAAQIGNTNLKGICP